MKNPYFEIMIIILFFSLGYFLPQDKIGEQKLWWVQLGGGGGGIAKSED
jgi:hypothetical protein